MTIGLRAAGDISLTFQDVSLRFSLCACFMLGWPSHYLIAFRAFAFEWRHEHLLRRIAARHIEASAASPRFRLVSVDFGFAVFSSSSGLLRGGLHYLSRGCLRFFFDGHDDKCSPRLFL